MLYLALLTALVLRRAALARGRGERLAVVRPPLQGPHALLDGAHHVPVEAVAVLAGVLSYDVGSVCVVVTIDVAAGLSRSQSGGHLGRDVVFGPSDVTSIS